MSDAPSWDAVGSITVKSCELVLVSPGTIRIEQVAPAPRFQVGDRVRLVDVAPGLRGATGVVEMHVPGSIGPWRVRVETGPQRSRLFCIDEHNLELIGPAMKSAPTPHPLDRVVEGVQLGSLLVWDERRRRDDKGSYPKLFSPEQEAAVSAHWSAQLRAKVAASDAAAKARDHNQVQVDADPEDFPW